MRRIFYAVLFLSTLSFIFAGFLFAQNKASTNLLRFPLWFVLEEAPAIRTPLKEGDKLYSQAIRSIKELAPFMLEALVYGWKFSYTPPDNLRGVKENFSVEPLFTIAPSSFTDGKLRYTDPIFGAEGNTLECWIEYDLNPHMMQMRQKWQSVIYPKIQGRGENSIMNGTDGIKTACTLALKDALRTYARRLIRNKPKEISGTVLLTDFPRYYINSGKYTADLDFFLFVSRIVEYTQF